MFMGIGKLLKLEKAVAKLPAAMTPTKIDGKWRAPELSRRAIAELRKAVLFMHREGTRVAPDEVVQSADGRDAWVWDTPRKEDPNRIRTPKGHKHEREKPLRDAKVAAALAKQPDLIAAYREKKRIKVKASPFDLFTLTTKELKLKARNIPQAKATKK